MSEEGGAKNLKDYTGKEKVHKQTAKIRNIWMEKSEQSCDDEEKKKKKGIQC